MPDILIAEKSEHDPIFFIFYFLFLFLQVATALLVAGSTLTVWIP